MKWYEILRLMDKCCGLKTCFLGWWGGWRGVERGSDSGFA